MAGVSRLQYSTEIRLIRVMCSGRVDLEFMLRAFSNGTDGVIVGGCRLNECNYITHGNYDALSNVLLCKKIMEHIGLNPERLRVEFMSSGDGILLAEVMSDFCKKVAKIGPLGRSEGIDEKGLKLKPDLVILTFFIGNDIFENFDACRKFFDRDGSEYPRKKSLSISAMRSSMRTS